MLFTLLKHCILGASQLQQKNIAQAVNLSKIRTQAPAF